MNIELKFTKSIKHFCHFKKELYFNKTVGKHKYLQSIKTKIKKLKKKWFN